MVLATAGKCPIRRGEGKKKDGEGEERGERRRRIGKRGGGRRGARTCFYYNRSPSVEPLTG